MGIYIESGGKRRKKNRARESVSLQITLRKMDGAEKRKIIWMCAAKRELVENLCQF